MREYKKRLNQNVINMDKVDKKYQDKLTDIVCYFRSELNEYDTEEAINDVLSIILEAQERGDNVDNILGDNYMSFCEEVVNSYKNEQRFYNIKRDFENISVLLAMIPFFFALHIIGSFFDTVTVQEVKAIGSIMALKSYNYNFTLAPIVNTAFAMIFAIVVLRYLSRNKVSKIGIKDFFVVCILFAIAMGVYTFINTQFEKIVIFEGPNYLVMMGCSALIFIGYFITLLISLLPLRTNKDMVSEN